MRSGIGALMALAITAGPLGAQQPQRGVQADSGAVPRMAPCGGDAMMSRMQQGMRPGEMQMGTTACDMQMGMMSGMMHGQRMMQMPGDRLTRRAMRFQPDHVLAYREELELTPEQVAQLQELETARGAAHKEAMSAAREEWHKLQQAFDADSPDTAAVRTAAERALQAHAALHARMIADAASVRAILSGAQREQAIALPLCGRGMMGQHGHGRAMQGTPGTSR